MNRIRIRLILSSLLYLSLSNVYGNTTFTTGVYENNQHLVDTLSIPSAKALVINVTGVTEGGYDFLTLYDGRGGRIARLSGVIYKNFLIPDNTVQVEFISDGIYGGDGVTVNISESSIMPPTWQTFQFDHPFFGVAHDPQRQRFYVVQGNDLVLELTEDTLATVATHPIAGAVNLNSIAYLNDALWLGDTSSSHLVYKLDLLSGAIQSFSVSSFPRGLGTDGTYLYVINDENSGILNIVDPATGGIIGTIITTIRNPVSITALPDGGDLLVLDDNQEVYQVEKATGNARYFLSIPVSTNFPKDITYLQVYGIDMIIVSDGSGRVSFGLFSDATIDLGITEFYNFAYKDYYAIENQGIIYLDLLRSGFDTTNPATVQVQLTGTSAIGGAPPLVYPMDFDNTPQTGYFPENSAVGTAQVVINNDQVDEENEALTLTLLDALGHPQTAILHIIDDDIASISILPTTIITEETGNTATFAVTLSTQPSAEVNIHVNGEIGEIVDNHSVLMFDPTNWNVPQTVAIAGIRNSFDWNKFHTDYPISGYYDGFNDADKSAFSFTFPDVADSDLIPKIVISKLISYPQSQLPRMSLTAFWDIATAPTLQIDTTDPHYSQMTQANRVESELGEIADTDATFTGMVSIDGVDFVGSANIMTSIEGINYVGDIPAGNSYSSNSGVVMMTINIKPAQADLGKKADLLFIMGVEPDAPYDRGLDTTYFSIGLGYSESQLNLIASPEVWVAQLGKSLEDPFIKDVTLESAMSVRSLFGLGFDPVGYYFFMGYRLEDGTIVYSVQPLTITHQFDY